MHLNAQIEYLRIEGRATTELLGKLARAIEQLARESAGQRPAVLKELRQLDHGLMGVLDHCHAGDRVIASMPSVGLTREEQQRSAAEHQRLAQAITDFRIELRFANVDHIAELITHGRALLNDLTAHFAEEAAILDRIERNQQLAAPAY